MEKISGTITLVPNERTALAHAVRCRIGAERAQDDYLIPLAEWLEAPGVVVTFTVPD